MQVAPAIQEPASGEKFYVDAYLDSLKEEDVEGGLDRIAEDEVDAFLWRLEQAELEEQAELDNILFGEDEDVQLFEESVSPSEFTEFAIKIPIKGDYVPFSFDGRRYLEQPYNTAARRTLLKCARQTEKTVFEYQSILLADGSLRSIKDIKVGDRVVSLSEDGSHTTIGVVTWKSRRYKKPCLRIKTKQNLRADVATTHPMRLWNRWLEAGELRPGQRLASLRRGGEFTGKERLPDDHVKFAAYMIGDGQCGPSINYTQMDGPCLFEFEELSDRRGWRSSCKLRVEESRTFCLSLKAGVGTEPRRLLESWGLWGKRSADKQLPSWVWGLDQRQSALFLNRLWSTDGSVKHPRRSQYEVTYSSISHQLVKDIQRLLWKFGIPSRIRDNEPMPYKGTGKKAYILRVQTQRGVHDFLTSIGALGKSEGVPLPPIEPNSNRDTYPTEINEDIREIIDSRGDGGRHGRSADHSLRSAGLRETLQYPPSRRKLQQYVDFFREDDRYDQQLVDQLAEHLDTDLYWDTIVSINDLGEQWCYDISVDKGESFVVDGLITHNSTMLGNKSLAYCGINLSFKVLYVSATATQAQVFSVDRLKDPIETSEELSFLVDSRLSQNVFFKQFRNRSQIRIRYAFLHADRCLHGDSRVQMADGTLRTIRELAEEGSSCYVVAAREDSSPFVAKATDVHLSGRKRVVRVVTDYPVDLYCSYDHPLKTGRGWVKAEDLLPTDFVAAPHIVGTTTAVPIGEDWAWLIGAMIAEGECFKKTSVRFTNSDEDYLDEFIERALRVGIVVGEKVEDRREGYKPCWSVGLYSDSRGSRLSGAKLKLWELGEFGDKARQKKIPRAIWKAPLLEKAAFLWALFCGDGWCSPDNGGARAGYSSSSKRLVEDVAILLWNVGIRSSIYSKSPSTENASPSWVVSLSKRQTEKLIELIGSFRGCPVERTNPKDDTDRIPITYQQLRDHLREQHDLSTHTAWIRHRIQLRPGNVKDSIGRRALQSIAQKLNDSRLRDATDDQKSWVRVRCIEEVGTDDVYDLTVEGPGCFMANGLVVHNTRGIPADLILIDEIQDIIFANVPVIEQCASHSDWKLHCYSGTPKSFDNTIEIYWSEHSTQNEWAVPCDRHYPYFWNILGRQNIGKTGPICAKCGAPINPAHPEAQWVSFQPVTDENADRVTFEGYRINQLMVPWIVRDLDAWHDSIIFPLENYGTAEFNNEVLGLSFDSGQRPLTRAHVEACCQENIRFEDVLENAAICNQYGGVAVGIDWGTGESGESYTVITLGGYMGGQFQIFYCHRFVAEDLNPRLQLLKIAKLLYDVNFKVCGADYGGGFDRNDWMIRNFGPTKVFKYQYAGNPKKKVKWEPELGRFMLHRTEIMSDLFNAIRQRKIWFPRFEEFRHIHGSDMLNIFSEYNRQTHMTQYQRSPGKPDDTFHSILYCLLASMFIKPRPDLIIPTAPGHVDFTPDLTA